MTNKLTALALFVTITLGCVFWLAANFVGLPDDHPFWNIVVFQIGAGLLVVTPIAIIRLLKSK